MNVLTLKKKIGDWAREREWVSEREKERERDRYPQCGFNVL